MSLRWTDLWQPGIKSRVQVDGNGTSRQPLCILFSISRHDADQVGKFQLLYICPGARKIICETNQCRRRSLFSLPSLPALSWRVPVPVVARRAARRSSTNCARLRLRFQDASRSVNSAEPAKGTTRNCTVGFLLCIHVVVTLPSTHQPSILKGNIKPQSMNPI